VSYQLYQQTMRKLGQTLSDKFSIPIQYSEKVSSSEQSVIIPLVISRQMAGHLQVHPSVSTERLDEIYNHVQWTLNSLEDLFQKYEAPFRSNEESFPIWFFSLEGTRALKAALDIYEKSTLRSFVHLHASVFDCGFFSADLKQVLIFISDAEQLSKEDQVFLAHYLRTHKTGPSVIVSSSLSLESSKKKIVSSLMGCFNSCWEHSNEWLNT